tara:strand:+ start:223 stop:507 length:285 start_codon:yes stop_codon:yes gene_type:complete
MTTRNSKAHEKVLDLIREQGPLSAYQALSFLERAEERVIQRDDKIAELEALLEKADKMHDERLYELQQLQKRYVPNWEQQVKARIEAARRKDGE